MTDREFLLVGTALYLGEGFKRDGQVGMANTDPAVLRMFVTWLRRCFEIDERRLRVRLYLHEGLDLETAERVLERTADDPASAVPGAVPGSRRSDPEALEARLRLSVDHVL